MELNKKTTRNIIKIAAVILVFAFLLYNLSSVLEFAGMILSLLSPFIIGGMIAFVMNVPMSTFENHCFSRIKKQNLKRVLSIICAFFSVVIVIAVVMGLVVPEIGRTIQNLIQEFPRRLEQMQLWLNELLKGNTEIEKYFAQIWASGEEYLLKFVNNLGSKGISGGFFTAMTGAISGTVSIVVNFFMGLIFSIYILVQKEKLGSQGRRVAAVIWKKPVCDGILSVLSLCNNTFRKFITGQCVEAVILAVIFFVCMSVFGMPYALTISVLIMLMSLIPIFGSLIGCVAGAFLIVFVNPLQALLFIIMFLIIQQIEGNLIYPHVVGNSIGLPSIWVFVAVLLGGNLFGIAGMLVFIPLCSVLYTLAKNWVKKKEREAKENESDSGR
ncbi:MAG: AI-2E family transporter [Lachnospiraceae bacterium]|nr:AI-2E family transporter [Lachnospiraceae bacterium]